MISVDSEVHGIIHASIDKEIVLASFFPTIFEQVVKQDLRNF